MIVCACCPIPQVEDVNAGIIVPDDTPMHPPAVASSPFDIIDPAILTDVGMWWDEKDQWWRMPDGRRVDGRLPLPMRQS